MQFHLVNDLFEIAKAMERKTWFRGPQTVLIGIAKAMETNMVRRSLPMLIGITKAMETNMVRRSWTVLIGHSCICDI